VELQDTWQARPSDQVASLEAACLEAEVLSVADIYVLCFRERCKRRGEAVL
jgi:hypothetical protein